MGEAEENAAPPSPPLPPAKNVPSSPPAPIIASLTKDPSITSSSASSPTQPLLRALSSSPTPPPSSPSPPSLASPLSPPETKDCRPSTSSSSSSHQQIPLSPPQPPVPYPPPPLMMPPPPPLFYQPHDYYNSHQYKPNPYFQPFPYTYPINPGYDTTIYGHEKTRQNLQQSWSTGLFDCFSDLKNCFITLCCPCFTFGQITEIVNEGQTPWWEGCLLYKVMLLSTLAGGIILYACYYRLKMRKKYKLKGNWMNDAITACLCHHCALCQQYRQLDRLGFDVALGWGKNREIEKGKAVEALYQVPPMVERGMFR